ncbi:hypothetical protein [Clostridium gasigenes]|uniref:hypothetical protein n=1 Tax=Clostridium gasigenes TaxID=94869 RepID=UPI001C0C88E0|nr:hypothetical protein [Clostridium gasigenes]MBU3107482.1 hypothetical protein [Clostridium gasigenes]
MYFVSYVRYKFYKGSIRANIFSMIGITLQFIFWGCLSMVIALLVGPTYNEDIQFAIPIITAIGLISFIIGIFMQQQAEKVGIIDFENKIKNNFEFAKKMSKENPDHKMWYMNQNSKYENYVLSGKEALEKSLENRNKNSDLWRNIIGLPLFAVTIIGIFYFISKL